MMGEMQEKSTVVMPEVPKDSLSKLGQRALQRNKKIAEKNYKKVLLGFYWAL